MDFGSIADKYFWHTKMMLWLNTGCHVVDGNNVILWNKEEYDKHCKTLNPPWRWPCRDVEVGNKIDEFPIGKNKKPIWTKPPDHKAYKIQVLKDETKIILGKLLFDGEYKVGFSSKKRYMISEVSAWISGKEWEDALWRDGFIFLIYEGKEQYRKLRLSQKTEWGNKYFEVLGSDVYLWNKSKFEATNKLWDWPYGDIGNVDKLKQEDKWRLLPKPIEKDHKIMTLEDGWKLRLGNRLYADEDNSGKGNNIREVEVEVPEGNKKVWKYGFMYTIYKGKAQIKDPRANRWSDSSQKDSYNYRTGKSDGKIPHKPVDLGYSEATISSGYYRTYWTHNMGKDDVHDFHGAIDISTNKKPNIKALAIFDVKFKKTEISQKTGNIMVHMEIEDAGPYNSLYEGKTLVYMHLAKEPTFNKGDLIKAGEQVGIVGKTGTVEIHLHLEIRKPDAPEKIRQYTKDSEIKINEGNRFDLNEFFVKEDWYKIDTIDLEKIQKLKKEGRSALLKHVNSLRYKLVSNPYGTDYRPKN